MIKFVSRLNLSGTQVDRNAGIIKGVSLISLGEARGHDKHVDQKTLETVRDCAKQYGDGLRVKFNPNTFTHGVGMLAGYIPINTIEVANGKTVGDLQLYKALPAEAKEYLYEICETTPGNIGISIEFIGDDEEIDGQKFARCDEIFSAVIVDIPAANPTGLFSVPEFENLTTAKQRLNPATTNEEIMDKETITTLSTAIATALKPSFDAIIQKFEAAPAKKENEEKEKEQKDEEKAAGVTETDTTETKEKKVREYRAGNKKVSDLSVTEFTEAIAKGNMQFFRQTGGRPAKASESDGDGHKTGVTKFEARVDQIMAAGCTRKSLAINRARQDAPAEYNEWMSAQHPNAKPAQQMERK